MKVRLVEAELFHADRRTDMTKLIVISRKLAKKNANTMMAEIMLNTSPRIVQKRHL
jgi:hypothetical protein